MFHRNQWIKLSLILLVALCTKLAFAAPKQNTGKSSVRVKSGKQFLLGDAPSSSRGNSFMGFGASMGLLFGGFGFSLDGQYMVRIIKNLPIYVGGTTGVQIFGWTGFRRNGYYDYYGDYTAVVVPLLATATYVFNDGGSWQPYAGLATGPAIGLSGWGSTLSFYTYARAGIGFKLSPGLTLDLEARSGYHTGAVGSYHVSMGGLFNFRL